MIMIVRITASIWPGGDGGDDDADKDDHGGDDDAHDDDEDDDDENNDDDDVDDDDGDDDYGRPIIRRIWTVEIPSLKITDQIHDAIRSIEDTVYEWDSDLSKYVKTYYK